VTAFVAPDRPVPTVEQAHVVPLRDAAYWLGIRTDTTAYQLARTGELAPGVPVLPVASRWVVPTAKLRQALGLDVKPAPAKRTRHARCVVGPGGLTLAVEGATESIRREEDPND
jgi:hypothetical protein